MSDLRSRVSEELLPYVRGPAQYIGGEVNQLARDWDAAGVRIALAFPDTYALGMSQVGCAILYWIANHMPGVACERVFSPWVDAEAVMRRKGIPLFTWESRRPVASADILAVSLQYEMAFSNVLNLLDLAAIPLRSSDRLAATPKACAPASTQGPAYPLVIVGGPQADNPEPLADFVDLVVIGDGEHAIEAIVGELAEAKRAGASQAEFLLTMARNYPWAYVPAFYDVRYHADGTVAAVEPNRPGVPAKLVRCRTPDFESAPFPTAPIVPWTQAVHERINVEIMRGCPQRCRFCHAGHTKRPLVFRGVDRIIELAEAAYDATGFEAIALTSLSTSDYPHLGELIERVNAAFAPRRVSVSVPSLRVDKQLRFIPWQVQQVRKSGLTIAAEAARPAMRQRIGKKVADVDLLEGVRAAYRAGWRSVKLYFMVGFPEETEDDVRGIVELARQVAFARVDAAEPRAEERRGDGETGRQGDRPVAPSPNRPFAPPPSPAPAAVTVSVSPLVPKPHTPFQWVAQRDGDYFRRARDLLRSLAHRSPVHVRFHRIERSLLEAVFARGDRRLGRAVEIAFRGGARFDGWDECFNYPRWLAALAEAGLDPAFYAHRERPLDEVLPWDHIESGAPRDWLARHAHADVTLPGGDPSV